MERHCLLIATFIVILYLVQAQDPTGFINVDCGLPPRESPYTAVPTRLQYTSDEHLINSGKTGRISKELKEFYYKPSWTLRYFPSGLRNCYNINVTRNTKYMIKAKFIYGNYDGQKVDPNFDLYLGPNLWTTVTRNETIEEIIHVMKSDSLLQICLVKTGTSLPFINVLEVRPLPNTMYLTQSGSLRNLIRSYFTNSNPTIRYPDDIYDREWYANFFEQSWKQVTTTLDATFTNRDEVPQDVIATGITPLNDKETLDIPWILEPPTAKFYTYLYFAELQTLRAVWVQNRIQTVKRKY